MRKRFSATILPACLAALAILPASASASADPGFEQRLLDLHNRERAQYGVPEVRWDAELASDAQRWADRLIAEDGFRHAPARINPDNGENIWLTQAGSNGLRVLRLSLGEEEGFFEGGTFPNISQTGNWQDVGHFSQVIWEDTSAIGCGRSTGTQNKIIVCRYYPQGNVDGQTVR